MRYAFIAQHRLVFAVRAMCRMLLVHPSGFYAWLRAPFSQRALEDQRQTKLLKTAWEESGEVYDVGCTAVLGSIEGGSKAVDLVL